MDIKQIAKSAADKFCGWKLPKDFYPDSFISFDREKHDTWGGYPNSWPTGTNLLTHEQAQAMFEYCLADALAQQKEPVGFMSPKQLERIKDPEDESGTYIPVRKTPAGNFTLALYTKTEQPEFLSQFNTDPTSDWPKWMRDTSYTASANFQKLDLIECKECGDTGNIFSVDGAGPFDCYACGRKATPAEQPNRVIPISDLGIAGIGLKHFGNPIPQAWYSAAKELIQSIPQKDQPVAVSQSLNDLLKDAENAIFSLLSAIALYEIARTTQFDQKQRAAKGLIAAEREALIVGDRIGSLFGEE